MIQPSSTIDTNKSGVETKDIIRYVRNRLWKYLIIVFISGGISFYILNNFILDYSSTSTFFINEFRVINNLENIPYNDDLNRIYQMVNSSPMQMHLINKFNLLKHYSIDTTKELYLQRAMSIIKSKIEVKKNPYNAISITVSDKYRFLSSDMANEIVSYLEILNQEFYIKSIKNTLQISKAFLKEIEFDNDIKCNNIDSMIRQINTIINSSRMNQSTLNYMLVQQQKLIELIGVFKNSTNDLINSQKIYNISLQAINFKNFPTINLLQNAMPAFRTNFLKAFIFSSLIMLLVFMLLILQVYFKLQYKDYLILIYSGK